MLDDYIMQIFKVPTSLNFRFEDKTSPFTRVTSKRSKRFLMQHQNIYSEMCEL